MHLAPDPVVRYQTQIDGKIGGPYTIEGLESLVYLRKITPETCVRLHGTADFAPIKSLPLHGILFPSPQPAPVAAPPTEAASLPASGERKTYQLVEAKFEKLNAAPGTHPKLTVHELLHEIRHTEIKSGFDHVEPRRFQISRRSKDFWFLFIAGNSVFVGAMVLVPNIVVIVFAFAGTVLFSTGLLWSMFGVMGRY